MCDTVVPADILERLDVSAQGRWPYGLADERVEEYRIGQTAIRIDGATRTASPTL